MKLSLIIVSYNVKNYLEQCLHSVIKAASGFESEIFVVDNNSADGSAKMVTEKFPQIKLIINYENLGFSKANNQALSHATGEYVLFLNPDTLVEHQTFKVCIDFMDSHPGAGAMGVKMIDGKGKFLPESKRSIPIPIVAFYKISGLTMLFPRSKKFGRYYLGHLDNEKTHEIEVLTGAFFFARKTALDLTGWFDEDFFMYGEDIDLSCRLLNNNYSIWYHPETSIIHYKGESTHKSTINYVLIFYKAMIIYARKHFNSQDTFLLLSFLYIAIWFRAALSITKRVLSRVFLPALDAAAIYSGHLLIPVIRINHLSQVWKYNQEEIQTTLIPVFISIWIVTIYLSGGYKIPQRITGSLKGLLYGSLAIMLIYAMLNHDWYFKLAILVPLALWASLATILTRMISSFIKELTGRKNGVFQQFGT